MKKKTLKQRADDYGMTVSWHLPGPAERGWLAGYRAAQRDARNAGAAYPASVVTEEEVKQWESDDVK